jgi:hypothetical protein
MALELSPLAGRQLERTQASPRRHDGRAMSELFCHLSVAAVVLSGWAITSASPPRLRSQLAEQRATSLVAELSQHVLTSGKRFACLFTDDANPSRR